MTSTLFVNFVQTLGQLIPGAVCIFTQSYNPYLGTRSTIKSSILGQVYGVGYPCAFSLVLSCHTMVFSTIRLYQENMSIFCRNMTFWWTMTEFYLRNCILHNYGMWYEDPPPPPSNNFTGTLHKVIHLKPCPYP